MQADLVKGSWVDPRAGEITLAELGEQWIDEHPSLRPRTREVYCSILKLHIRPGLGEIQLNELSPSVVRRWHATLTKAGKLSQPTIAKCYRVLHAMLQTALADELIVRNPCVVKGASVDRCEERPVASLAEVKALAVAVDERYRALILTATLTGMAHARRRPPHHGPARSLGVACGGSRSDGVANAVPRTRRRPLRCRGRRNYLAPADLREMPVGVWVEAGPYSRSEWLARGVAGAAGVAGFQRVNDRSYLAVYETKTGAMWRLETTGRGAHTGLIHEGTADTLDTARAAARAALCDKFPEIAASLDHPSNGRVVSVERGWRPLPDGRDDRTEHRRFDDRVAAVLHAEHVESDTVLGLLGDIGMQAAEAIRSVRDRWGTPRLDVAEAVGATVDNLRDTGCSQTELGRARVNLAADSAVVAQRRIHADRSRRPPRRSRADA